MRLSCGHILPGTTEEAGGTLHILMLSVFPSSKQDSLHLNTSNFACTACRLLGWFCHRN